MAESKRTEEAKRIIELIQEAVDKGANTVEEIHKSIADLPLKMLEEIEVLKKPVKEVRRVQDRSIGAVYDLIREINAQIRKLAAEILRADARPPKSHPRLLESDLFLQNGKRGQHRPLRLQRRRHETASRSSDVRE